MKPVVYRTGVAAVLSLFVQLGSLSAFAQADYVPELGAVYNEGGIAKETPAQSLYNLWKDIISNEFIDTQELRSFPERQALLEKMPRVAKLFSTARTGTPTQKAALRAALIDHCDAFVNRIPSGLVTESAPSAGEGEQSQGDSQPDIRGLGEICVLNADSCGVLAVPLIMLEAGIAPREILWWMAQMNRRFQCVHRGKDNSSEPGAEGPSREWLGITQVDIYAGVADKVLHGMLEEQKSKPEAFSPREKGALSEFTEIIKVMDETTASSVGMTDDPELKREIVAENAARFSSVNARVILKIAEHFTGISDLW